MSVRRWLSFEEHTWLAASDPLTALCIRPFSSRPAGGRGSIRNVGTTPLVEGVRVEAREGPAIVDEFWGAFPEDRREEKEKNEQELHSWRSGAGASLFTRRLDFIRPPETRHIENGYRAICGDRVMIFALLAGFLRR